MYFDLSALIVVWFVGAVLLAGTGAGTAWLAARALQTQGPRALWLDAVLGPLAYAVILVVAKPDVTRVDWVLIGSFAAPIAHQAIVRFARN
jgi:hypothetical protein